MAITQLFGKCREQGYCTCGGVLGCTDDTAPLNKIARERKKGNMDTKTPVEKLVKETELEPTNRNDKPGNPCRWCTRRGEPCKRHGGGESQTYPHRKKSEANKVLKNIPSVETVELDIGDLKIVYTKRSE